MSDFPSLEDDTCATGVGRVAPLADVGVARWLLTTPLRSSVTVGFVASKRLQFNYLMLR